jgi:Flp pilus assembly protein TadB
MFKFFLKTSEARIIRSRKNSEAEISSAIRVIILDMKANASMFDALRNVASNFNEIGVYLDDVINKVRLGSSLETALSEAVELVPSESFRVLMWQLINYLQTGTDVIPNLRTLVDEIVENQKIEFKKYGKRLNVLSLMYMIIAIILPTIGFTLVAAGLIFIGFKFNVGIIIGFWVMFTVLQVMFLAIGGGNRPVVES